MKPIKSGVEGYPIPSDYVFPPAGTSCMGYDNETLVIRFPTGSGLQKYHYLLTVDVINGVINPNQTANAAPAWSLRTRVR